MITCMKGDKIMKFRYLLILLPLLSFTAVVFSASQDTIQEITTMFTMKMLQQTGLNRAQIAERFPSGETKRAFIIALVSEKGIKTEYLALMDSEEKLRVLSYPKLVENPSGWETVEKYVKILLSFQDSLFSYESFLSAFSPTMLLMQDMGYINLYLDSYSQFIDPKIEKFKSNKPKEDTANIFNTVRHNGLYFLNNITNYLGDKPLDYARIIYEPTDTEYSEKMQKLSRDYFSTVLTQIDIQNYVLAFEILQRSVISGSSEPLLNGISPVVDYATPLDGMFVSDKMGKTASMILLTNMDIQKKIALSIQGKLSNLNDKFAKSYGVMYIEDLKDLLVSEIIFQIFSLNNFKIARDNANPGAITQLMQMYFPNNKKENADMDTLIAQIEKEIYFSACSISQNINSTGLFEIIDGEWRNSFEYIKKENPNINELEKSKLIQLYVLKEAQGHFARVRSTIDFDTDEDEYFVKNYPIYDDYITGEGDTIIVDFLWVLANHPTSTIFRTLGALISNGFNFTKLEEDLSVENISMEIEGFIKLNPYYELWRMEPSYEKRVAITLQNNSQAKNAIKNIFAGYIPDYFKSDIQSLVDIENIYLTRYPVEVYTEGVSQKPVIPRNDKALIFIHGKQQMPYFDENNNPLVNVPYVWRGIGRVAVWDAWYEEIIKNREVFSDFDFYEFLYDSSVLIPQQYGAGLADILNENGFLDDYGEIYIVSHSMGGLVTREAVNSQIEYGNEKILLGEKIEKLFTLDTPHWGTVVQNFILTVKGSLIDALEETPSEFKGSDMSLFGLIRSFLFGDQMDKAADLLIYFSKNNPEVIAKLFSEMLSFLDPFPGGRSMEYASKEYDKALAKYLYPQFGDKFENVLMPRNDLERLNETDNFYGKLYLISAEVSDQTQKFTQGYYITYKLMEKLAQLVSHEFGEDYLKHVRNDAVVPLFSQQIWGVDKGVQRIHFENLDHDEVTHSQDVIEKVMGIFNGKYFSQVGGGKN